MGAGAFRSDLFYRLNVFPIEMPALRERQEDIPMLVAYFVDRYARKAGKTIESIDERTFEILQAYRWPGNIRELQNVIERSVIICESETFAIDESWLRRETPKPPHSAQSLADDLAAREREMIETALAASGGRVSGPSGAAAKLGIPGSTLDSKIKALGIRKERFKGV
jgi:formate hydrogenlyase transcriptional activator